MRSKLLSILLIAAVAATLAGDALAQRPRMAPMNYEVLPEPSTFGYIPPPMVLDHIRPDPDEMMPRQTSWDWRALNGVTPVKNQNPYGTCWVFASLGDLESKVRIAENVIKDYAELNIQACHPGNNNCYSGGNAQRATNYLTRFGSVEESCSPYPGDCPDPSCINPGCPFQKQVTEWRRIPNSVASIKNALMTYGPVYTSMYASFQGFLQYSGSHCITYTGSEDPDHSVVIVGWDDAMCNGNGAWIVKNSWGTHWGDGGYFYIQYGHARIGTNSSVITGYRDHHPAMTLQHWDEWGQWAAIGYGDGHDHAVVAIIPQNQGEYLHSVHFWATSGPTTYTIQIFRSFDGSNPPSDPLPGAGPWTGTVDQAGYYTIDLDVPVAVQAGVPLYIYAGLNTGTYQYPLPCDTQGPMETNKSFISDHGTSYVAVDAGGLVFGDIGLRATTGPGVGFAGGSGTAEDPWQVADAQQLNNVRNYLGSAHDDKHFVQIADISLNVSPWNTGEGWAPIGDASARFHGSYDGGGHVISGLYINRPTTINVGLFGFTSGAVIENLGLANVTIHGRHHVGSIVGQNYQSTVRLCYASGDLYGNITTMDVGIGGLVGYNVSLSSVHDSYSRVNVTDSGHMGFYTGGLAGFNVVSSIVNCYSTGAVNSVYGAQGLVGGCAEMGFVQDSYWDTQTSGVPTSTWGLPRTTAEMTYPHAANTYENWDFFDIWANDVNFIVNNGYPYLRWQQAEAPNISVSPTVIAQTTSTPVTLPLTITNTGVGDLVYSITFDGQGKEIRNSQPSLSGERSRERTIARDLAPLSPVFEAQFPTALDAQHHEPDVPVEGFIASGKSRAVGWNWLFPGNWGDGPTNAIGMASPVIWYGGAIFDLSSDTGRAITRVGGYDHALATSITAQVYTGDYSAPTALVGESAPFVPSASGEYFELQLNEPVTIGGTGVYWIAFKIDDLGAGHFPFACHGHHVAHAGKILVGNPLTDPWTNLPDHGFNASWLIGAHVGEPLGWLTVDPLSGTVPAGQSDIVNVTLDPTGLAPGTYDANIVVHHNAPGNPVVVPVQMTVMDGICYGWENGGLVLGTYLPELLYLANTGAHAYEGSRSLEIYKNATGSTPQAWVAWITDLRDGDEVQASIQTLDFTEGAHPAVRIWGRYTPPGGNIDDNAGSAGGNPDYSGGPDWVELSHTWYVPLDRENHGLVIEIRAYNSEPFEGSCWVDHLCVTAPEHTTVHFPTGAATDSVYVCTTGDPGNSGLSPQDPLDTIGDGIARAALVGAVGVCVAEGTYAVSAPLEMIEGISLYGGYNTAFTTRDPTIHETVVNDLQSGSTQWTRTVNFESDITNSTVFDGFTINGGSGTSSHLLVMRIVGAPWISNNIIRGWQTGSDNRALSIQSGVGVPVIMNNEITTRSAQHADQGIYVNRYTIIANNIIHSLGNSSSRLVTFRAGHGSVLYNNLIICGSSSTNYAVHIEGGPSPDIRNNIIFATSGTSTYGLWEHLNDQGPSFLQNNNYFDLTYLARLRRAGAILLVTEIEDLNDPAILEPTLTGGNVNVEMVAAGYFIDAAGGNWRLADHCPLSICHGGQDLAAEFAALGIPAIDKDGVARPDGAWSMGPYELEIIVSVPDTGGDAIPSALAISTVAPNPFNPRTTVWLDIPRAGSVQLAIHDLRGRLVRTLWSGQIDAGRHPIIWDGLNEHGQQTASGVYLVRLVTAGEQKTAKITLAK